MAVGLLRALAAQRAPLLLLLLLLIATSITTHNIRGVDGASFASTETDYSTDNTESCPTEEFACLDDETCSSCLAVTSTNGADIDQCLKLASSSSSSATTACSSGMGSPCCIDEVSEHECLYNELFVEYMLCVLENEGCLVDEISCDAALGSLSGSSDGSATAGVGGRSTAAVLVFCCTLFTVLLPLVLLWA